MKSDIKNLKLTDNEIKEIGKMIKELERYLQERNAPYMFSVCSACSFYGRDNDLSYMFSEMFRNLLERDFDIEMIEIALDFARSQQKKEEKKEKTNTNNDNMKEAERILKEADAKLKELDLPHLFVIPSVTVLSGKRNELLTLYTLLAQHLIEKYGKEDVKKVNDLSFKTKKEIKEEALDILKNKFTNIFTGETEYKENE